MKAFVAVGCCLLVFLTRAGAQQQYWTFAADLGPSIPLGEFGAKNLSDTRAAFAGTGPILQLTAAYRIGRHWGVTALAGGGWYRVNTDRMAAAEESINPGTRVNVTSDPWIAVTLMGGVYGQWRLAQRWNLVVRGYAGVLETKRPKYTVQYSDVSVTSPLGGGNSGSESADIGKVQTCFAFQADAGVEYTVWRKLFISGRLAYAAARYKTPGWSSNAGPLPASSTVTGGTTTSPPGSTGVPTYIQPISSLNPTVGVGFHL